MSTKHLVTMGAAATALVLIALSVFLPHRSMDGMSDLSMSAGGDTVLVNLAVSGMT